MARPAGSLPQPHRIALSIAVLWLAFVMSEAAVHLPAAIKLGRGAGLLAASAVMALVPIVSIGWFYVQDWRRTRRRRG